jgi:hypothetical protein
LTDRRLTDRSLIVRGPATVRIYLDLTQRPNQLGKRTLVQAGVDSFVLAVRE